jgi:cytochrome c biogenesis protein CcmG, thiol:disulfide interchange protein DsbE
MTSKQQWMFVGAVVFAASGMIAAGTRYLGHEFVQITVGSRAPSFAAVTVTDNAAPTPVTLDAYKGKVTLLNVWATYCIPCRTEMPSIQRLYDEFRDRGLQVVAVSVDAPGMERAIRDFSTEYKLSFDILYDAPGLIQRDYMTVGVPETFLIGKDGVIRYKEIGGREWDSPTIRALVEQLLAESGP